jgi:hypothetical protein
MLPILRAAGLAALPIGAVGSIVLFVHATQRTPPFLVVLFVIWLLSPFAAFAALHVMSKQWSAATRTTLYGLMLVITLVSLTLYGNDGLRPRAAAPAFLFVLVPPLSWLLIGIAIPAAALISRRHSDQRTHA